MNQIPLNVYSGEYAYPNFNCYNPINPFGSGLPAIAATGLELPALLTGGSSAGVSAAPTFTPVVIDPFKFISAGKIDTQSISSSKSAKASKRSKKTKTKESQGFFSRVGNALVDGYHKVRDFISDLGQSIISTAAKYLGFNEANGSYKKFTGGRTEHWCADFVTYVTKEAFRRAGKAIPSGFGSPSVSGLREWGKQNGRYMQTAGKSNKASLIAQNVKPGDIIIFKEAGASHTGIVESVDSNGTIHTIEGNTSDKVARRTYSANHRTISGFIQMA